MHKFPNIMIPRGRMVIQEVAEPSMKPRLKPRSFQTPQDKYNGVPQRTRDCQSSNSSAPETNKQPKRQVPDLGKSQAWNETSVLFPKPDPVDACPPSEPSSYNNNLNEPLAQKTATPRNKGQSNIVPSYKYHYLEPSVLNPDSYMNLSQQGDRLPPVPRPITERNNYEFDPPLPGFDQTRREQFFMHPLKLHHRTPSTDMYDLYHSSKESESRSQITKRKATTDYLNISDTEDEDDEMERSDASFRKEAGSLWTSTMIRVSLYGFDPSESAWNSPTTMTRSEFEGKLAQRADSDLETTDPSPLQQDPVGFVIESNSIESVATRAISSRTSKVRNNRQLEHETHQAMEKRKSSLKQHESRGRKKRVRIADLEEPSHESQGAPNLMKEGRDGDDFVLVDEPMPERIKEHLEEVLRWTRDDDYLVTSEGETNLKPRAGGFSLISSLSTNPPKSPRLKFPNYSGLLSISNSQPEYPSRRLDDDSLAIPFPPGATPPLTSFINSPLLASQSQSTDPSHSDSSSPGSKEKPYTIPGGDDNNPPPGYTFQYLQEVKCLKPIPDDEPGSIKDLMNRGIFSQAMPKLTKEEKKEKKEKEKIEKEKKRQEKKEKKEQKEKLKRKGSSSPLLDGEAQAEGVAKPKRKYVKKPRPTAAITDLEGSVEEVASTSISASQNLTKIGTEVPSVAQIGFPNAKMLQHTMQPIQTSPQSLPAPTADVQTRSPLFSMTGDLPTPRPHSASAMFPSSSNFVRTCVAKPPPYAISNFKPQIPGRTGHGFLAGFSPRLNFQISCTPPEINAGLDPLTGGNNAINRTSRRPNIAATTNKRSNTTQATPSFLAPPVIANVRNSSGPVLSAGASPRSGPPKAVQSLPDLATGVNGNAREPQQPQMNRVQPGNNNQTNTGRPFSTSQYYGNPCAPVPDYFVPFRSSSASAIAIRHQGSTTWVGQPGNPMSAATTTSPYLTSNNPGVPRYVPGFPGSVPDILRVPPQSKLQSQTARPTSPSLLVAQQPIQTLQPFPQS